MLRHPSIPAPETAKFPERRAASVIVGALARRPGAAFFAAFALVALIALADYATGYEVRLAVLYALPVFIASWSAGRLAGVMIAAVATISWLLMFRSSHPYSESFHYYWEGAILLCTLTAFALLLARLREALAYADERFVTVLEGLDAAVYVGEVDGGAMLYTNRRFLDLFGPGSEAQGVALFERAFVITPADFAARAAGAGDVGLQGEFRDPRSGRCFVVHANSIRWVDGRRVGLKVLADVTEAKRDEELARQQQEKLQQSGRLLTIGEMASGLAHELNQPLTAIATYNQGCVRMLQSGDFDRRELLGFMEKCSAQAIRAGAIIQRIREFVRKREPVRRAADLNRMIEDAASLTAAEADKNRVQIELDLAPHLPPVLADSISIEQVLVNLMRNGIQAMEATPAEARRVVVRTHRHAEAMLQVSVSDSGHGITADVADRLYTAFFSTKEGGMGIGLNICRSIVEFHGGRLWHERAGATGTIFSFTLPVNVQAQN